MKSTLVGLLLAVISLHHRVVRAEDEVEFITYESTRAIDLADMAIDWQLLEYDSPKDVRGVQEDWNGDGVPDTLLVAPEILCGTGGCPYHFYDGKSGRRIGDLFGRPIWIHSQKINGWPVLTMYGHSSAESGFYATMVFDGAEYVVVSGVKLYGNSVVELFDALRKQQRKSEAR
jgi:hypothetical protein